MGQQGPERSMFPPEHLYIRPLRQILTVLSSPQLSINSCFGWKTVLETFRLAHPPDLDCTIIRCGNDKG